MKGIIAFGIILFLIGACTPQATLTETAEQGTTPTVENSSDTNVTEPQSCPLWTPPSPTFCQDGTIVPGEKNENGCQGPPKCDRALTNETCETNHGHWNGHDCLCGGIAGWNCPTGYSCANMMPPPPATDRMGVCRQT